MKDKVEKDFLLIFSGKKVTLNLAHEASVTTKDYSPDELSYFNMILCLAIFPTGIIMDELKTKHQKWYEENFFSSAGHFIKRE